LPKAIHNPHNKVLIWDFDGTLAWRPGGWAGALVQVLHEAMPELAVTPEQVRPYLQSGFPWHAPENTHPGLTPDEWWADLYPLFARALKAANVPPPLAYTLAQQVRAVYLDPLSWRCFTDTVPALETLSSHGWLHILLSNHVPELPDLLEQLGLASNFTALFNSAETGIEKPNPKAFRAVLDWIGPSDAVWLIGDSYHSDIAGALEVNLPAILVRQPNPLAADYAANLDEVINKLLTE
jgi:putative hydrolase of the HAD superfamily